jgi:putative membrane protein
MGKLGRIGFVGGVVLLAILGGKLGKTPMLEALGSSAAPIACASAYHLIPLAIYTQSWRSVLPREHRPGFWSLLRIRWMGESINALLPVAQVGGDVVRAIRLVNAGMSAPDASASMVGDLGTGLGAQLAFTVVGLLALSVEAHVGDLARPLAAGLAFVVGVTGAGTALLRFGVHRIASRLPLWRAMTAQWKGLAGGAARLDASLRAMMKRRRELVAAFLWHLLGWFAQAVESWMVLAVAGMPIRWSQALVIESLTATARAAAFFVPGGLGVQEATVVGVAHYLGLPVESGVTLSLVKRMREIVVGGPAVVLWALTERVRARHALPEPTQEAKS